MKKVILMIVLWIIAFMLCCGLAMFIENTTNISYEARGVVVMVWALVFSWVVPIVVYFKQLNPE
jgi:membrane protein YdbS with pleckstrin-like domain